MGRRTRVFPSDEVQGEGSYVRMSGLTRGQIKERAEVLEQCVPRWEDGGMEDFNAYIVALLPPCIQDWNWTDAAGEPIPVPETVEDLDAVTIEELRWLHEALDKASVPSEEEKKD